MKKSAIYIMGAALALTMLTACGDNAGTITTPVPTATAGVATPTPKADEKPSPMLPDVTDDAVTSPAPSIAGTDEKAE